MSISVAIVEDQPAIRNALVATVERAEVLALFGAFGRAEDLFAALAADRVGAQPPGPGVVPDAVPIGVPLVVLMDIRLPGIDGIEATARLSREFPGVEVLMLTVFEDEERIFRSLQAGASGYLIKSSSGLEIVEAISGIARGESPMSGSIARKVVESFQSPPPAPGAELSGRECEILDLLVGGLRYKEIAARLSISIDTVRTHIRHIYDKLHVRSRGELTARLLGRRRD